MSTAAAKVEGSCATCGKEGAVMRCTVKAHLVLWTHVPAETLEEAQEDL